MINQSGHLVRVVRLVSLVKLFDVIRVVKVNWDELCCLASEELTNS